MIDCVRNTYIVRTNELKRNSMPLSSADYLNIGYMSGRFGINLNNNPDEANPIFLTKEGAIVSINSCTSDLFEENLKEAGIKFDRIA